MKSIYLRIVCCCALPASLLLAGVSLASSSYGGGGAKGEGSSSSASFRKYYSLKNGISLEVGSKCKQSKGIEGQIVELPGGGCGCAVSSQSTVRNSTPVETLCPETKAAEPGTKN
jgi:hypothetical protein